MNVLTAHPVVNLTSVPDAASEQVSQLLIGSAAAVQEERGAWWRVQGPDNYEGWAEAAQFVAAPPPSGEIARILPKYANLRFTPSSRSGPILCAPSPATLPVVERQEGWVGLQLPGGLIGWVEETHVEAAAPRPASVEAILQTAREFLGVPYLWGGVSGFGIDCSGFVQAVFGMHGVSLPRDAHQQAERGQEIEEDTVEPGDLVYFAASPNVPRRRISHVALAVDRDHILHALGGRAVVETGKRAGGVFWGARRLLKGIPERRHQSE